eukprot:4448081-Pyramimonas_sp.AAC.1
MKGEEAEQEEAKEGDEEEDNEEDEEHDEGEAQHSTHTPACGTAVATGCVSYASKRKATVRMNRSRSSRGTRQ